MEEGGGPYGGDQACSFRLSSVERSSVEYEIVMLTIHSHEDERRAPGEFAQSERTSEQGALEE